VRTAEAGKLYLDVGNICPLMFVSFKSTDNFSKLLYIYIWEVVEMVRRKSSERRRIEPSGRLEIKYYLQKTFRYIGILLLKSRSP